MKKFLRVVMGLILCMLLLSGCNTSSDGSDDSESVIREETEIVDEPYVVVEIQINPLFSLTMDENNIILYVVGLNQDAEQLLAEIDIINMDYAEGMFVILNKAYEMEFIDEETAKINIDIMFRNEVDDAKAAEITETLKQPVVQFQEEKELGVEVVADEPLDGVIVKNIEYNNGDKGKAYYRKDSSGANILFREILEIREGTGYKEFYYGENGDIVQWNILDYETGRYQERWYWPSESKTGELIKKKEIGYEPDGSVYEDNYDESGNPTFSIINEANGTHTEITFYENGNRKHEIMDGADGVHTEIDYYENGNPKTRIEDGGEGHFEIYYNVDGEIERQILNYADGRCNEYYEDGSFKYGYPDGSWVLFDADGNVIDESN